MDFEDKTLAEFAENDLKELWVGEYVEALKAANDMDLSAIFESGTNGGSGVILNDRLIAEASLGSLPPLQPLANFEGILPASHSETELPPIKSEHSYSLSGDPPKTSSTQEDLSDLERECFPAIPISEADGSRTLLQDTHNQVPVCSSPKLPIADASYLENDLEASSETLSCCEDSDLAEDFVLEDNMYTSADFSALTPHGGFEEAFCSSHCGGSCNCSSSYEFQNPFYGSPFSSDQSNYSKVSVNEASNFFLCKNRSNQEQGEIKIIDFKSKDFSTKKANLCTNDYNAGAPTFSPSSKNPSAAPLSTSGSFCPPNLASLFKGINVFSCHTLNDRDSNSKMNGTNKSAGSALDCSISSESSGFCLPPTPPSCSGSDTESGIHSPPSSPLPLYEVLPQFCAARKPKHNTRTPITTPLISSQPKGATGVLNLTEEEKKTLVSEGYPIPSRLPLTKAEEKSLKKIRRKIKNKISAQESRRKKKEYMDTLETRVEILEQENTNYKRRVETLQQKNSSLIEELRKLQSLVAKEEKSTRRATEKAVILT